LVRMRGIHSPTLSFSRFDSSGFFLLWISKRYCLLWKSAKCEWAAECVTNEMFVST
jgi:hypothetical protein